MAAIEDLDVAAFLPRARFLSAGNAFSILLSRMLQGSGPLKFFGSTAMHRM